MIDWRDTGRRLGRKRAVPPPPVIKALSEADQADVSEFFIGYIYGIEDNMVRHPGGLVVPAIQAALCGKLKGGKR